MTSQASYLETDDPRQDKLERIARRLFDLLGESQNEAEDRLLAESMLFQADLWNRGLPDNLNRFRFCDHLIAENPLLYQVIEDVRAWPEAWDQVETVEELMHHCIPSEGDVELR